MRLSESACVLQLGDGSFSCLNLGQSTGRLVKCVLSLGIRNGDEVVVVVVLVAASSGRVLTQVEMSRRERVFFFFFLMAMILVAQAKYMVLRVSW